MVWFSGFVMTVTRPAPSGKKVVVRPRVSSTPLEVERRFSDPIRIESGCESSLKGENRRGETLSHDGQERHPGPGSLPEPEWAGAAAHGGVDRALEVGRGRAD